MADKYSLPVNTPSGTNYQKAETVDAQTGELDHSWLGRYQDVGWAIRITPRLTDGQWQLWSQRADETWDYTVLNYDPHKALELLGELFPRHTVSLTWPKCGKRHSVRKADGKRYTDICGTQAKHTEVHVRDVNGAKVGIARCDRHRGQL